MNLWLLILFGGLITFGIRLSFIALFGRVEMPPALTRALRFVPPAVLSAIIAPALFAPDGALNLSLANNRLLAGVLAILVAWRSKNVVLTLVFGLIALWLFQAL